MCPKHKVRVLSIIAEAIAVSLYVSIYEHVAFLVLLGKSNVLPEQCGIMEMPKMSLLDIKMTDL